MTENKEKQQEIIQDTNWFKRNKELYGLGSPNFKEGYNVGYEKALKHFYKIAFEAGVKFSEENGWVGEEWDNEVDKVVSKNIEEIINENETSGDQK